MRLSSEVVQDIRSDFAHKQVSEQGDASQIYPQECIRLVVGVNKFACCAAED